jgi:hypothetical protein
MCSRCGRGRARRAARSHRGPSPVGLRRVEGGRARGLAAIACREGKRIHCESQRVSRSPQCPTSPMGHLWPTRGLCRSERPSTRHPLSHQRQRRRPSTSALLRSSLITPSARCTRASAFDRRHAFGGRDDFSRPLPMRVGGCGVKRHIGGRVLLPDWLHVSGCCATLTVDTREMLQPDHPHGAEFVIGSQCGVRAFAGRVSGSRVH